MIIDKCKLDETDHQVWVADASDLELRPGYVPGYIEVQPKLGNGQPFLLMGHDSQCFRYMQANGCVRVTIFND